MKKVNKINFSDILVKQNDHIYDKEYQDMKKGKIITDFPSNELAKIKIKKNLSLTKLQEITNSPSSVQTLHPCQTPPSTD